MAHRPRPPPEALVRYRDIYPQDVLRVDDLQRQLFPVRYSESFYQRLFTPGHYTVLAVTAAGEVVGIASARTVLDEVVDERREGYIMTLGVRADFRNLGVGGELLRRIMGVLRVHCTVAALHVKSLNADALRFYERNGFREDPAGGWYPGHYLIEGVQYDAYKLMSPLSSGWINWLAQRLGLQHDPLAPASATGRVHRPTSRALGSGYGGQQQAHWQQAQHGLGGPLPPRPAQPPRSDQPAWQPAPVPAYHLPLRAPWQ
ncbi:acyl-CoA N-acyltransferase [Pavlovales sp. CCMP2436]|nr:acyl-CoA N-acyltransferase [Pavlovales sp. CCMP2436]